MSGTAACSTPPTSFARDWAGNVGRRRGDDVMAAGINWQKQAEMDPTIQQMLEEGVPMTRENYLDAYFNGEVPEDIEDADLPAVFQLFNQRDA